jgi:hypothetical protein
MCTNATAREERGNSEVCLMGKLEDDLKEDTEEDPLWDTSLGPIVGSDAT